MVNNRAFPEGSGLNKVVILAVAASRLAALLVGYMHPACALLAPGDPGASTPKSCQPYSDQSPKTDFTWVWRAHAPSGSTPRTHDASGTPLVLGVGPQPTSRRFLTRRVSVSPVALLAVGRTGTVSKSTRPSTSAWLPQHRNERRRPTHLDRAENFKPVTPIQGNISWVGGFQVGRRMMTITLLKGVRHQRGAATFALMGGIHADER